MNSLIVRTFRVPSLLLAAALQILPVVRVALPATQSAANVIVILFRWCAGAAAALGSVHAVSGGSTVITCPKEVDATNGVPFKLRLTTAPHLTTYWLANNVPPGLSLSGSASVWYMAGTPTVPGTYNVHLTAKETATSGGSRTVYGTVTVNVISVAPQAPAITGQPSSTTAVAGQEVAFTVTANGFPLPSYQWQFNGAPIPGETAATLYLTSVTAANAGQYSVVVGNNVGTLTSDAVTLAVNIPDTITVGTYNGLYFDPSNPAHPSSGFVSFKLAAGGDFSGTMQNGKKKNPFHGKFGADGRATNEVPGVGTVELYADRDAGNLVTGRVLGSGWTAHLGARVATTSGGRRAGAYTLVIPGADNGANAPLGDSFASLKILPTGSAMLSGTLADGSRMVQRTALSAAGEIPVYVPLYSGNGAVFGWLRIKPSGAVDFDGNLNWIRPPGPAPKLYTSGFSLQSPVSGSTYARKVGPLLGLASGKIVLTGGNLPEPHTTSLTFLLGGKVTSAGPDKLTFSVVPTTGLFKGVLTPPGGTPIKIQGALLQKQGSGSGFFLGATESGNVYFGP